MAVGTIRRVRNVVEAKAFTDATEVNQASGSGDYLSNYAVGSQSENEYTTPFRRGTVIYEQ